MRAHPVRIALAFLTVVVLLELLVWTEGNTATAQDQLAQPVAPRITVVMSGLDNPRGLAFGPEEGLYVAEAGRGPTDHSCFDSPEQQQCTKTLEGQTVFACGCSTPNTSAGDCAKSPGGQIVCSGPTGAMSRLWHNRQERLVTGLPSWATSSGRAEGPNDVALLGRGEALVTIGLEASPRLIADMRSVLGSAFGRLLQFSGSSGEWGFVADLAAYEEAHPTRDPSNGTPDSNPFGLLVDPGERVVVDAGGNALLRVAANGHISTLAVLPSLPQCLPPPAPQSLCVEEGAVHDGDPVPTRIALGPDGAYYVGILTGAPFPDGAANVYRIVPREPPDVAVVCTGFFDGSGSKDPYGTIASYAWNFGDGTSGAGVTTGHTYAAGSAYAYNVTLTVTDSSGTSSSQSKTVIVNSPPVASFTFSCNRLTCSFDASGSHDPDGSVTTWTWNLGDGTMLTGSYEWVGHTYPAPGTYIVTLTVTDKGGATGFQSNSVKVPSRK
jgi:PKD domain